MACFLILGLLLLQEYLDTRGLQIAVAQNHRILTIRAGNVGNQVRKTPAECLPEVNLLEATVGSAAEDGNRTTTRGSSGSLLNGNPANGLCGVPSSANRLFLIHGEIKAGG